jgi:hypothetical protein
MKSMTLVEITEAINKYYNQFKVKDSDNDAENAINRALLCLETQEFINFIKQVHEHKDKFPYYIGVANKEEEKLHSLDWYFDEEKMIALASLIVYEKIDFLNNRHVMNFIEYNYNFDLIDEYFLNPIIGKRQRLIQEMLYTASASNQLDEVKKYVNEGAILSAYDIDKLPVNIAAWNASNVECLIYLINQGGHFWYKKEDTFHTDILDVYKHVRKYIARDDEYDDKMKARFDEAYNITLEKLKIEKIISQPEVSHEKNRSKL